MQSPLKKKKERIKTCKPKFIISEPFLNVKKIPPLTIQESYLVLPMMDDNLNNKSGTILMTRPKSHYETTRNVVRDVKRPYTSLQYPRVQNSLNKTLELELGIKKNIEFEFEGLSKKQREVMLKVFKKSETTKFKFNKIKKTSKITINDYHDIADDIEVEEVDDTFNNNDDNSYFKEHYSLTTHDNVQDLCFPLENYDLKSSELVKEEKILDEKFENISRTYANMGETPKKQDISDLPLSKKYKQIINRNSKIKINDNGERIDIEFTSKIKEVTNGLSEWVNSTLESPVNLQEYIEQHILTAKDVSEDQLRYEALTEKKKPKMEKKLTAAETHIMEHLNLKKEKEVAEYGFLNELETAMNTWKPTYLNKKKGKMLNIISETVAPENVLKDLTRNFNLEKPLKNVSIFNEEKIIPSSNEMEQTRNQFKKHFTNYTRNKVNDYLETKIIKNDDLKNLHVSNYGRWYINPKNWNRVQQDSIKKFKKLDKVEGEISFVQRRLLEIQELQKQEDMDILSGRFQSQKSPRSQRIRVASVFENSIPPNLSRSSSLVKSTSNRRISVQFSEGHSKDRRASKISGNLSTFNNRRMSTISSASTKAIPKKTASSNYHRKSVSSYPGNNKDLKNDDIKESNESEDSFSF
ncbi:hypothetical protein HDU92_000675 [Lobulomyces angularis]|nr:hypothetical protein HDU92_000675 [Lobulomyces angularis]